MPDTPTSDVPTVNQNAKKLTAAGERQEAEKRTAGARAESSLRTAGQRRINQIWEFTQSFIAVAVTTVTLVVCALIARRGGADQVTAVALLSNAFFLVIGFYFGRTNHTRMGGVGGGTDPGTR
jgi:hypothetical protein